MRRHIVLALLLLAACDRSGRAAPPQASTAAAPSAAGATPAPEPPSDLIARGNEPFWAVEIKPSGLTLMRPDHADVTQPNPGPSTEGAKLIWETAAYRLAVEVKACSDGMSDRRYPFAAEIRLADGTAMTGCAGQDDRPGRTS